MATIDNLTIEINADTKEAERKIKSLASALSALSHTGISTKRLNNIAVGFTSIKDSIKGIREDQITKVERLAKALNKISKSPITGLYKSMQQVNSASKMVAKAQETATESVEKGAKEQIEVATDAVEEQKKELISAKGVWTSYIKGTHYFKSADQTLQDFRKKWTFFKTAGRYAKSFVQTVMPDFSKFKSLIRGMIAPIQGFIRSIGRIALYRAIRSLIKAISAGIKEGVQNLAMFSMLVEEMDTHKANRVMSLYTSNFLYLKNAIATAVIPVFKALEPVIDAVIKKTVEFINILAQLASFFSGSSTYTKAKYYYVDYAKSLDKASGSASKLNKQLAQFDELNNLTTSGGSGSGTDLDYLKMFEDPVPIEDWILNLKNANWETVARTLSERLRGVLDNIDWESIKEKVGEAGRKIAGFFNGLFTPENFRSVASTIAEAINTAFEFLYNLGDEFNAYQAGESVSQGVMEFFKKIDFGKIADTLDVWVKNLKDLIKGALKGITKEDWKEVFASLFEFLKHIDLDTVEFGIGVISVITIGKILKWSFASGVLEFFGKSLIESLIKNGGITLGAGGIANTAIPINTPLMATAGELMLEVGTVVLTAKLATWAFEEATGHGLFDKATAGDGSRWGTSKALTVPVQQGGMPTSDYQAWTQTISDSIPDRLKKNMYDEAFSLGENIAQGMYDGIESQKSKIGIKSGVKWIYENWIKELCNKFIISSPAKAMYPYGEYIALGIIEGIKNVNFFAKVNEWYENSVKPWFSDSKWKDLGNSIKNNLSATLSYSEMWKVGNNMGSGLYNAFSSNLTAIWNSFVELKNKIANNPIVQTVKTVTSGGSSATQYVASAGDSVKTLLQLANDIEKQLEKEQPTISSKPSKPAGMPDSEYKKWLKSLGYAHGGYPSIGSLFVAGEAGAELVGNFNGRTGVANTDQIEEAMYQATYDAMSKALSENGMNVTIEGDVDNMFRVMQRRASDFYTRTGRPAF